MTEKELQFKEIYETNYAKVHRLCLGYMEGDTNLAEDLTQEVFVKVWENLESFREESAISTWIYRIGVNTCLSQLRKLKKMKTDSLSIEIAEPSPDVSKQSKETMLTNLYACINKLTEMNKAIIILELEGLPQKEIAEIMGIKHEAIRTRIHRIKGKLTKCANNE